MSLPSLWCILASRTGCANRNTCSIAIRELWPGLTNTSIDVLASHAHQQAVYSARSAPPIVNQPSRGESRGCARDSMPVEAVAPAPDTAGELFVARQPIFNRKKEIYAYELLHRSSMENRFDGTDNARATTNVIAGSFLNIGMNKLVGASRAFINFDRTLLLSPLPLALPPEKVVIELLETIEVDDDVIARCRELRRLGFAIALDDYDPGSPSQRLVDLANIIKIDFRLMDSAARKEHTAEFRKRRISLLAEKVETPDEFQAAVEQG